MTIDFLDFLKKSRGKFAFVATYEFDPLFFERRILSTPAFDGALVVVFVDNGRYQEILATGRQGQRFDRDYFVIPMGRTDGVFHPKLYLAIGDKQVIASVGSNNCTSAGTGHNFELISTLEAANSDPRTANMQLIASIFRQFRRYAQEAGAVSKWLHGEVFDPVETSYPWLADASGGKPDIELLSSHDGPLWPQLVNRLAGEDIREVTLLAPFFGKRLGTVERVKAVWPKASIRIVSQSGYSDLPISRLIELQEKWRDIELISATPQTAGRKMHAKTLAFRTPERTFWLAGSANMSHAALAGGHSEACLWFATRQTVMQALKQDDLLFAPIAPDAFETAPIEEPKPAKEEALGLKLQSLILTDRGQLSLTATVPRECKGLTLRIFKRGEAIPALSRDVGADQGDFVLTLKDGDQSVFDRPAVGQLRGSIDGQEVASPLLSVTQIPQLLYSREGGNAAGNRLQRVMESGDGIVEYIDSLDGIDLAIDFMNTVTIRFNDDTTIGGGSGGAWRPRDPFSGDVPDLWGIGSDGGSVTELREAIWQFVQRHVQTRLLKHAARGNLSGLSNFLDIYRAISRLLLAWHNRKIDGEIVVPHGYVTSGLQEILTSFVGGREGDETEGFGRSILAKLRADKALVISELGRQRVAGVVRATVEEMILVRSLALKRPIDDAWSQARREWVSRWIDEMGLAPPTATDVHELGAEFKLVA